MKFEFDTTKLKTQVQENPLIAAGLGVATLKGLATLGKLRIENRNSKTYRKEVNRRTKLMK